MTLTANSRIASEIAQTPAPATFVALLTAAASDQARCQVLTDLVIAETADGNDAIHRGYLDEMSPIARVQLGSLLVALKASLT